LYFFEAEQLARVLDHLPAYVRPVIKFAGITGWRVPSEVLPLEWRQVDLTAGDVKLDAGTTKNGDGRVFPLTAELRRVLEQQQREHERLKKAGHIWPRVFFRETANGRGAPRAPQAVGSFKKVWRAACAAAGCPGRIPHDLRRTAVRNLVRAGVPERVAMKLTGHKTRSVFDRYDITSPGDLREAARKLDLVPPQRQAAHRAQ
jgi:integrase